MCDNNSGEREWSEQSKDFRQEQCILRQARVRPSLEIRWLYESSYERERQLSPFSISILCTRRTARWRDGRYRACPEAKREAVQTFGVVA